MSREYWCRVHKRRHAEADEGCELCVLGEHFDKPVPAGVHVDYRGWRFTAPFICMGCGIPVCVHQWCFSRSCGPCDVSTSTTRRLLYGQCFAGSRTKLAEFDEANGDIPEDHFVDPAKRLDYPVMQRPKPRIPPRIPRPHPPRKPPFRRPNA